MGKNDIDIAREARLDPIIKVAAGLGLAEEDIDAGGAAHHPLSAMLDNHLVQGNALGMVQRRVIWKRVLDMNERALRDIVIGLGGPVHGIPRESGFEITVASEVMAILCLSR